MRCCCSLVSTFCCSFSSSGMLCSAAETEAICATALGGSKGVASAGLDPVELVSFSAELLQKCLPVHSGIRMSTPSPRIQ
jgi:hypothetical protein